MRGWLSLAVLALLASVLSILGRRPASAQAPVVHDVHARSVADRPVIDGDLAEWPTAADRRIVLARPDQVVVAREADRRDRRDLGGWVGIGVDRTTLYIYGRVTDDRLVARRSAEMSDWTSGDAIELFLETAPPPAADATTRRAFDDDDYQIFLWPAHGALPRWGLMQNGGWIGDDGHFEGVRVAFRLTNEPSGYTFEAAFPLINFPHLRDLADGREIGFNIALADREPVQVDGAARNKYVYLTWNGEKDLWQHPERFGRLRIVDPDGALAAPPAPEAASGLPVWMIATVLLLTGLGALVLTRLVRWIARWSVRRKVRTAILLSAALLVAWVATIARRAWSDGDVVDRVNEAGRLIEDVREAASPHVADEDLVNLLTGQRERVDFVRRHHYDHVPLAVPSPRALKREGAAPGPNYIGAWVPIEVTRARPSRVHVPRQDLASSLALVMTIKRRPGLGAAAPNRPVVTVTREIDAPAEASAPAGADAAPTKPQPIEVRTGADGAFVGPNGALRRVTFSCAARRAQRTGVELLIDTRDWPRDVHATALRIAIEDPGFVVEVYGLATADDSGWRGIPMRVDSLAGPSLLLDYGADGPVVSATQQWRSPVEVGRRFDRLWIFFRCERGFPNGSAFGTEVADVVVRYTDGDRERHPLLSGVHLETHTRFRLKHRSRMLSKVALNDAWDLDRSLPVQSRRDVITIPLRDQVLESVELVPARGFTGPESIEVIAITGGVARRRSDTKALDSAHLVRDPDRATAITLSTAARATLEGVRVTPSVVPIDDTGTPSARTEAGEAAAYVGLSGGNSLRVAGSFAPAGTVESVPRWASLILLALLVPVLLVLLADALGQSRRLRTKLLLATALAALPPLTLLLTYIDGAIDKHLEARLEQRTRSATDVVAREVVARRRRVAAIARRVARTPELSRLVRGTPEDGFAGRMKRALDAALLQWPEADRRDLDLVVWDAALNRVFAASPAAADATPEAPSTEPPPTEATGVAVPWFVSRVDQPGLYAHYGQIYDVGFVRFGTESNRWALFAVRPLPPSFIDGLFPDDGETTAIAFHAGGGFPFAGTREQDAATFEGARRARILGHQAAAGRGPAIARHAIGGRDKLIGLTMLRDGMEEPILAVGAAVDREAAFSLQRTIRRSVLWFGALMVVLGFAITFLVTRRVVDPLERLSGAAKLVASGEPVPRLPDVGPDEVGRLAHAFTDMSGRLATRLKGLELLNRGMSGLNDRHTVDEIVEHVVTIFAEATVPTSAAVLRHRPADDGFEILGGQRSGRPFRSRTFEAPDLEGERGFLITAMHAREAQLHCPFDPIDDAARDVTVVRLDEAPPAAVVTLPLERPADPIGLIVLTFNAADLQKSREAGTLDRENLMVMGTLAGQVAGALENARLYQLAVEDRTTGLLLRTFFEARLREEIERATRTERRLALVKLCIDELPIAEQRFGRSGVDVVLKGVANGIGRALRKMPDAIATRFEDDAFAFALPEADTETGREVVDAFLRRLGDRPIKVGGEPFPLRPRVAVVGFPDDAISAEFLLGEADRALGPTASDAQNPRTGGRSDGNGPTVFSDGGMVLKNHKTLGLVSAIERMRESGATVLVTGETGTGKEMFAELIHRRSLRHANPLVRVNCAALPELLLESELFGHEKGAFTGADQRKIGRFERADGGTLFLDEIGEISASTQVKLLRVLQDRKIERLGATKPIDLDVRIIAATNRDLARLVGEGTFREDLFYRLNVIQFEVPPLRERLEEIPALVESFIADFNRHYGRAIRGIRPDAMDTLHRHAWPGNVRELKNVIERALVAVEGDGAIEAAMIKLDPAPARPAAPRPTPTRERRAPRRRASDPPATNTDAPAPVADDRLAALVSNPRQIELLKYLRRQQSITNQDYYTMMKVSQRTGLRDLNDLIEKGLLQRIGARRGAVYKIRTDHPELQ